MKTLFPRQEESKNRLLAALRTYGGALDSSHTGVGKTVIACRVADEHPLPVAVICPKIVIPHWERELAEVGIKPRFVTNYEKIKRGGPQLLKTGKKSYRWTLPEQTLIIWDEVHKCAGAFSQNAQMLVAAKQAGHHNLMLSATACQDPTEMRSIGYVLGLHSLNKAAGDLTSWFAWMKALGCRQDPWRKWLPGPVWRLAPLNKQMYSANCVKLTPMDLPLAFSDNQVLAEPLAFSGLSDIVSFYKDSGITPDILQKLEDGAGVEPHVLAEIMQARRLAEIAKVPDIVAMVADARVEGFSVVVFLNFTDTLNTLKTMIPEAGVIHGRQTGDERELEVDNFQTNRTRVILCIASAGGVGVSLHDVHGGHPRMSLISPSFSLKEHIQVLGRIHRAGGKTPALQRILIASKTIEEKILVALEKKRKSLDALHA